MINNFDLKAEVWLYPGKAAWHFITIPENEGELINELFSNLKRGWGSLKVNVTIGATSWDTSIFPDKKSNSYLLPLKSEVRKKEKIEIGDVVNFILKIKT